MKNAILTFAIVLIAAPAALASPDFSSDGDLTLALLVHVRAVQTRDLAALERTITESEELDLILPNGKRTTTRKAYVDFHREWFKETNWTWTLQPVATIRAADMAIITARTHYEEKNGAETTSSETWLSLTFRREKDGWRLVHDQNTRIASGP
jgi:Domain of unknown function (DUF4440)